MSYGRIVLPLEFRRALEWRDKNSIQVVLDVTQKQIILKKTL